MDGDGKGYELRDYKSHREFSFFREFTGNRVAVHEWKERIAYMNEMQSQPVHWHKRYCSIMSQKSTNYCWCYCVVAGIKNAYARQGVGDLDLNAYATAYRGKNGANRGGFVSEGCKYVQDYGVPEKSALAEFKKTRRWTAEQQKNADKHKMAEFEELGKNDIEGVVSALIGKQPCAVAIALSWWRHAVLAVGCVLDRSRQLGLIIANSWSTRYAAGGESGGYGIIWGKRAVPYEAVAIRHVTARNEA